MTSGDAYYSTIDNIKKTRNIIHSILTIVLLLSIVIGGYIVYNNFNIHSYVKIFFFDCLLYVVYKIIALIVFKIYNKKIFESIEKMREEV